MEVGRGENWDQGHEDSPEQSLFSEVSNISCHVLGLPLEIPEQQLKKNYEKCIRSLTKKSKVSRVGYR
ncbi:hypothetical protein, partial [Escherichia coli]|uniref:hypothetical protein n=1 Tax=Escherichia coli TaxID=562 RepID=UPI001BC85763